MEQNRNNRMPLRRKIARNRSQQGIVLFMLLFGLAALFGVYRLFAPAREYSDSENRKLAQAPAIEWKTLSDGTAFSELEAYHADQFAGRDFWISLKLKADRLLGRRESNGVYLCKDDYLIETPTRVDENQVIKNQSAIEDFANQYPTIPVRAAIIPNAICVLSEKLPNNAPRDDQATALREWKASFQKARFLNVTDTLMAHKDEEIYYRTDHHWTSLGAKYAFEAMAKDLGIADLCTYKAHTVSDSFEGTLSSKSGSHAVRDLIEVYEPVTDVLYTTTYSDSQKVVCSVFDRACLEQKDQYTVFFGGNHPRIDIQTTADTGRTLLLFKDSYANCFVQFLTPYYDRIIIIDPRYYYDSISACMRRDGVTDVLFLYNYNTFTADTSLADVLAS